MRLSTRVVTVPIVLSLALAGGAALADNTQQITAAQIYAELPAEVASDGQQFTNQGVATELRHRVNEQSPEQAKKVREQYKEQQEKQAKHQYKHQNKLGDQPNTGSFGAFGGKGSGGGGGRH